MLMEMADDEIPLERNHNPTNPNLKPNPNPSRCIRSKSAFVHGWFRG